MHSISCHPRRDLVKCTVDDTVEHNKMRTLVSANREESQLRHGSGVVLCGPRLSTSSLVGFCGVTHLRFSHVPFWI